MRELEAARTTSESTMEALRLGNQIKDEDINLIKREKVSGALTLDIEIHDTLAHAGARTRDSELVCLTASH